MNTYNFDVNYTKGVVYGPNILLVSNDHNSTIFKFNFDQTGRHVFKLLYPDGTCYVQDIIDNQLILTKGILNQEGNYQFEVSLYKDDSRLTTARIKEFPVRLELVDTDSVVQPDDRVPILDNLIEETNKVVEAAKKGEFDGATFTPNVSENGDLSWTNDKGKENPPTVNIKGEPGEPGEPGAVKMQVVDTLPEVGETDTIYLLKKDTPGYDNYYDEYVYTTNSGWEHIGDTSVDLTDYYTKEETDNKLYNKQDKINRFYVVDCKNTLGDSTDEINNIYDTDILNQLTNIMNECYTNGYKSIAILFSGKNSFITYTRHGSDFSTQKNSYYLYGYLNLEDTYDTARIYTRIVRTEINGTWNNNVFTTNGLFLKFGPSFIVPDTSQVLTKTNTTGYTPTNDYNPATKKYVDDNKYALPIASASTLGGIKVGENLTIDENGVLSASGGTNNNIPSFFIDIPSQPLNENNTGTRYTLPTSFNEKLTTNLNNILDIYQTFSIQFLINNILVTFNPSYSIDTSGFGTRRFNSTSKPTSINLFANIVNNKYDISASADPVMYGGFLPVTLELTLTWDNTTPSVTKGVYRLYGYSSSIPSIRYIQKNLLTKTNTTGYTPTNDYNPATKKYVDDNIKIYNISIQSPDNFLISNTDLKTKLESILKQHATFDTNPGFALLFSYTLTDTGELYYPASVNGGTYNTILFRSIEADAPQDTLPVRRYINPFTVSQIEIEYTNTYTINKIKHNSRTYNLIAWDNQQEITPLGDYNVATKKYVDDTIASAITTSLEGSY